MLPQLPAYKWHPGNTQPEARFRSRHTPSLRETVEQHLNESGDSLPRPLRRGLDRSFPEILILHGQNRIPQLRGDPCPTSPVLGLRRGSEGGLWQVRLMRPVTPLWRLCGAGGELQPQLYPTKVLIAQGLASLSRLDQAFWKKTIERRLRNPKSLLWIHVPKDGVQASTLDVVGRLWLLWTYPFIPGIVLVDLHFKISILTGLAFFSDRRRCCRILFYCPGLSSQSAQSPQSLAPSACLKVLGQPRRMWSPAGLSALTRLDQFFWSKRIERRLRDPESILCSHIPADGVVAATLDAVARLYFLLIWVLILGARLRNPGQISDRGCRRLALCPIRCRGMVCGNEQGDQEQPFTTNCEASQETLRDETVFRRVRVPSARFI